MPILALCEKGLILDVFGPKPQILNSEAYKVNNNKLVSVFKSKVVIMDLNDSTNVVETTIPGFSELIQSQDGNKIAILCHNKILRIYKDNVLINELSDVENYGISNGFYCYATKTDVKVFDYKSTENIYELPYAIKTIHCLNNEILFITEKAASQKVLLFKNGKTYRLIEHPQIFRTVVESNENGILLLADTEYTGNSYYADSILYYIKFTDLINLSELYKTDKANKCSTDEQLIAINELFGIISFAKLKKVHSFGFKQDSIYVCFGDQPAFAHLYSSYGLFEKKLKTAVRNTVIFNRSGKRVINAGFGNLPGNIEVFENGNSVCYFESLGASCAAWLPDDTRFMVATTNYFKSDNKICVYDYYGRLLEVMTCNSLVSAEIYGKIEDEITISVPEKILKQKTLPAYVPPHLQPNGTKPLPSNSQQKTKTKQKVKPLDSIKKPTRSLEVVKKELHESYLLKEKLAAGEELSLDDQNKVFRIKKLLEELDRLSIKTP